MDQAAKETTASPEHLVPKILTKRQLLHSPINWNTHICIKKNEVLKNIRSLCYSLAGAHGLIKGLELKVNQLENLLLAAVSSSPFEKDASGTPTKEDNMEFLTIMDSLNTAQKFAQQTNVIVSNVVTELHNAEGCLSAGIRDI